MLCTPLLRETPGLLPRWRASWTLCSSTAPEISILGEVFSAMAQAGDVDSDDELGSSSICSARASAMGLPGTSVEDPEQDTSLARMIFVPSVMQDTVLWTPLPGPS